MLIIRGAVMERWYIYTIDASVKNNEDLLYVSIGKNLTYITNYRGKLQNSLSKLFVEKSGGRLDVCVYVYNIYIYTHLY